MRPRDIPNMLCILRMVLTIPVVWAIVVGRYEIALLLFLTAGITDGLDGFLAKRFSWQSWLGGILDPAADKLLLVASFLTLWFAGYVPGWLLAAVVGRDLVIVFGVALYRYRVGSFAAEPTIISKLNSFLQLLYVLLTLLKLVAGVPAPAVIAALGWAVLVTTLISGLDYVISWTRRARAQGA
jgi:cardiolipin synthase (CMP-forming)